jgi:hypothetical protein
VAASCEPTLFPQDLAAVRLSVVKVARLPVFLDPEACARSAGVCPSKAYLVQGDQVLAAQAIDLRRCVAFVGSRRVTIGWVDAGALTPNAESQKQTRNPWDGVWTRRTGSATAKISHGANGFRVEMNAFANMAAPSDIHTGSAGGALKVAGEAGHLDSQNDPDCHIDFRRLGDLLLVNDGAGDGANSACGGMGVTFNGIYVRR